MNTITHYLYLLRLAFGFVFLAGSVSASPHIDIEFETDQSTGQEWIHAKANCDVKKQQAYEVFNAIIDYPAFHHWIQNAEAVNVENFVIQEFLIGFDLPWPVGEQWSRVQIQSNNSVISWRQIEGSLNANSGSVTIIEDKNLEGEHLAHVDYRAILDLGYPDAFTREYKEQFVSEFLVAIYNRLNSQLNSRPNSRLSSENQLVIRASEVSVNHLTAISAK
jgi:hypothetical protein